MKKHILINACCFSLLYAGGCSLIDRDVASTTSPADIDTQVLAELPIVSKAVAEQPYEALPREAVQGDIVIQETGLLADKPGFIGNKMGATVESVIIDSEQGLKTILILVPVDPSEVDSIEVVDRHNQPLTNVREPKLIRDYENNNVGVKLFVSPKKNLDFKIKLRNQD
ncbi:MAG: hypothetical protein HKO71_03585 [Pseudomonadales bacterium]|nr:hypothetical protein [Gammaproteobacteria bacterium]NNL56808.1 hypothetical protein [Pseudomonadales bacterium]